jgi:hypothetical protein
MARGQHRRSISTAEVPQLPIIDPDILPPSTIAKRASADGPVPINTSYGQWLKDQPLKTQQDVLGPGKVPYFNRLVDKYGAKGCNGQAGAG